MKKRQVIGLALAWALLGVSTAIAAPPAKPKEQRVVPPAVTRPAGEFLKQILRKLSIATGTNPFGFNDINTDPPPPDEYCLDPNGELVPCRVHVPVGG